MENNAVIKGVAYYHPENMVDNDYFIEYFKKQGKNIEGLLKATGRKNRYVSSNEEETILTMGYHASVEVINKTHIKLGFPMFAEHKEGKNIIFKATKERIKTLTIPLVLIVLFTSQPPFVLFC